MNVQRWGMDYEYEGLVTHPAGKYVTYADHVAALRACEARVREDERSNNFTPDDHADAMTDAFNRGLDAARNAVAALLGKTVPPSDGVTEALAAIDGIREATP